MKQYPPEPEKGRGWPALPWVAPKRVGTLDVYGRSGVEFRRLFPDAKDRFKVSTAARMNATFPYLSPAVDLPTDPPRRVVDAGFYDNYGVGVAAGWLNFWGPWLVENTSGVLLIQIRDSASHHDRRHLLRLGEGGDRREGERVKTSAVGG